MKKQRLFFMAVSLLGLLATGCQGPAGPKGDQGNTGTSGADGVSIVRIAKTESDGLVDTYTIYYSNEKTDTFQIRNGEDGQDGKTPYIGTDGNWWIDGINTGVPAGEDESEPQYTLAQFQSALDYSKPTKVISNQSFEPNGNNFTLHYASTLTIEYGSETKTRYDYTYEKMNEVVSGNESFISTISNTLYSKGSGAYDGVQWVNKVDGAVILNGVVLEETIDKSKAEDDPTRGLISSSHNLLRGKVADTKVQKFFKADYHVTDLNYAICVINGRIAAIQLTFNSYIEAIEKNASVSAYTTFSYDTLTVNIPE